jgi:hypothetical protein
MTNEDHLLEEYWSWLGNTVYDKWKTQEWLLKKRVCSHHLEYMQNLIERVLSEQCPCCQDTLNESKPVGKEFKKIKYGCHVDFDPEEAPEDCVLDAGNSAIHECIHAQGLIDRNKTKLDCPYWREIK